MQGLRTTHRSSARRAGRGHPPRRGALRGAMVVAASVVAVAGITAGTLSALGGGPHDRAEPVAARTVRTDAATAPRPAVRSATPVPADSPSAPTRSAAPAPRTTPSHSTAPRAAAPARLYRYPDSQAIEWVHDHPGDSRGALIASRVADEPTAVWFADFTPSTITSRVRAVTSGAAAAGRVPVVVPYAIPQRDCGGASEGGAPDLDAYDAWIDSFAAGLGSREVIVVLEPDSVAETECLTEDQRADRFASLARAGRVLKGADPRARVYYDAGHSDWNPADQQAALLKRAGAASAASSDGVFSNVSNFNTTAAETAYDRKVLAALGGPAGLGAVIDTSRNGNGPPVGGSWCDPDGRRIGRAPTLATGASGIDGYLWVKLPGESDGCKGTPGTFSPEYAYELAGGTAS